MGTIDVYEPALCCSTGVCGPDLDQELVRFSADLEWLRAGGGDITRYNLASEPMAFVEDATVKRFLEVSGSEGLPLVLVDGDVAMAGRYPGRAQLARWAGLPGPGASASRPLLPVTGEPTAETSGCCGGGTEPC